MVVLLNEVRLSAALLCIPDLTASVLPPTKAITSSEVYYYLCFVREGEKDVAVAFPVRKRGFHSHAFSLFFS